MTYRVRLTRRELITIESLLRMDETGEVFTAIAEGFNEEVKRRPFKPLSTREATALANRLAYIERASDLRQSLSHAPWRAR